MDIEKYIESHLRDLERATEVTQELVENFKEEIRHWEESECKEMPRMSSLEISMIRSYLLYCNDERRVR